MAIDIEKIRAKLERLNNNGRGGPPKIIKENIWLPPKPGEDEATVRMIANPLNDKDDPFSELWWHYDVGRPGFLCPQMVYGETCPVCGFRGELFKKGGEANKSLAKKMFPQPRYYALVVDRSDEELKAKYWAFGKKIQGELFEKLINPDYCEFLDHEKGLDMLVKQTKDAKKSYADTSFTFRRKESALAESEKDVKTILSSVVPLLEIYEGSRLTTKQVQERLNAFLVPAEDRVGDESDVDSDSKETVKGSISNVDKAFEDLLNDDDVE